MKISRAQHENRLTAARSVKRKWARAGPWRENPSRGVHNRCKSTRRAESRRLSREEMARKAMGERGDSIFSYVLEGMEDVNERKMACTGCADDSKTMPRLMPGRHTDAALVSGRSKADYRERYSLFLPRQSYYQRIRVTRCARLF